ncbi:dihydrolipoamide acyltransferase, partial [candidate division WOR-3 bacterium]|nr:dihydrolipoamide acyltransferase [candidate division WOR-3 bacterium]MBD3363756.1 dihydrolipoamide acyltransferase [candidate division WOR-3 bacterium]
MDTPDPIGSYSIYPFAKNRSLVLESLIAASWRHHVKALLELDVTRARAA